MDLSSLLSFCLQLLLCLQLLRYETTLLCQLYKISSVWKNQVDNYPMIPSPLSKHFHILYLKLHCKLEGAKNDYFISGKPERISDIRQAKGWTRAWLWLGARSPDLWAVLLFWHCSQWSVFWTRHLRSSHFLVMNLLLGYGCYSAHFKRAGVLHFCVSVCLRVQSNLL